MRNTIMIVLSLAMVLDGCSKAGSREEEISYLRGVVADSLLDGAHLDVGAAKCVALKGEGQDQYLGLHLFPGMNKRHGGIRAEISVDYPFQQGDTVRYSWRFMVPTDFVSDSPKNRWCVIGQWHDQPNKKQGETWDTFHSASPPILLGLGELNGMLGLSLGYGPTTNKLKQQVAGPVFLERGKWHTVTVVIRWSQGAEGKASVFIDDTTKPAMNAEGPNMNNDFEHYLKLGMYRHPEIETDNWIYIDDVTITKADAP